jgi:hypothetical protein
MVFEHAHEHPSQWAAMRSIAEKLGCTTEALRRWVRQAERASYPSSWCVVNVYRRVSRSIAATEASIAAIVAGSPLIAVTCAATVDAPLVMETAPTRSRINCRFERLNIAVVRLTLVNHLKIAADLAKLAA